MCSAEERRNNLDGVLDRMREVFDGARGCLLLRRVLGRAIGLGDVRDYDLDVALGAERPRVGQRLPVEHASLIHVQTLRNRY